MMSMPSTFFFFFLLYVCVCLYENHQLVVRVNLFYFIFFFCQETHTKYTAGNKQRIFPITFFFFFFRVFFFFLLFARHKKCSSWKDKRKKKNRAQIFRNVFSQILNRFHARCLRGDIHQLLVSLNKTFRIQCEWSRQKPLVCIEDDFQVK